MAHSTNNKKKVASGGRLWEAAVGDPGHAALGHGHGSTHSNASGLCFQLPLGF